MELVWSKKEESLELVLGTRIKKLGFEVVWNLKFEAVPLQNYNGEFLDRIPTLGCVNHMQENMF